MLFSESYQIRNDSSNFLLQECVGFFECGGLNLLDDAGGGKKNKLHKSMERRSFAMMMKKYVLKFFAIDWQLARGNNRKEKTYLIQKRNSFSIGSKVEDNCVLLKLGAYFKLCSDAVNPEVKDAKIWLCSMKYSFKDIIGSILWVINALLASQWCCILHHDIKC